MQQKGYKTLSAFRFRVSFYEGEDTDQLVDKSVAEAVLAIVEAEKNQKYLHGNETAKKVWGTLWPKNPPPLEDVASFQIDLLVQFEGDEKAEWSKEIFRFVFGIW